MSVAISRQENFSQDKAFKNTKKNHSKKTRKRKHSGKGKKTDKKHKKQKEKTHTSKNKKNKKSKNKILKSRSKEKNTNTSDSDIRSDLPLYRQRKFHPVSKSKKHNKEISKKMISVSVQNDKKKKLKKKSKDGAKKSNKKIPKKGSKKETKNGAKKSNKKGTKKELKKGSKKKGAKKAPKKVPKKGSKKGSKMKKDELKIRKSPATRTCSFPNQKSAPISKGNRQSSMLPNSNQSQRKIIDLLRRQISQKQTKLDRLQQEFHKIEKERNDVKVEYRKLNKQRHKLLCSKCVREKVYLEGGKIDQIVQQQCKEFVSRMEKGLQTLETIKNRNEKDSQLLNISQNQLSVIQKIEI
ncbi:hypothetical protein M0813_01693 [Anaeramoeba flamelloides]|uniref:Uncharacterized protein n=1 Tax=Anaeramoeba flamelloides TaxID=1746091 RepID=A0ABQ8YWW9_9EUKA|nr:hypothetical protein M0813_01693 [Anaeramoeba flamelloides]